MTRRAKPLITCGHDDLTPEPSSFQNQQGSGRELAKDFAKKARRRLMLKELKHNPPVVRDRRPE
jgi:hypothetical protein